MDIPGTGVGGSNRGVRACPAKSVRVYPRLSGAATECAPRPGPPKMTANPEKRRENNGPFRAARPQPDCLFPAHAYLEPHDGPFPLRKHLCGTASELFRAGRTDPGRFAATDQAEPAAGDTSRPRSGSAPPA